MCGIAGHFGGRPGEGEIARVWESIRHRGPDDEGKYIHEDVVLLHRRLSILDLSDEAAQPMTSADGRYVLVYNGEIYNYLELRADLEKEGVVFKTASDTEVLLEAYARWGRDVLPKLVGMFAFAVYDRAARKVFLARDFLGIKPLYYATPRGAFAFASEIPALLEWDGVGRAADAQGVYSYLQNGTTDRGGGTLFRDVRQIPGGHWVELDLTRDLGPSLRVTPVRWWSPEAVRDNGISFREAADELRDLFLESVDLHLRSDVAVGSALSGGIDSSSIVMAIRHLKGRSVDIETFSYIPSDPRLSEEHWVDVVGKASGARVHKVRLDALDLPKMIRLHGEPFNSASMAAQHQVFSAARERGIKVMLDGQGADEMFAGYDSHLGARVASLVRRREFKRAARLFGTKRARPLDLLAWAAEPLLPAPARRLARPLVGRGYWPEWMAKGWFLDRGVRSPESSPMRSDSVLGETLTRSLEDSLPRLLRYEDRNSMASGVESRVPFLTPKLVAFANRLPEDFLIAPDGTSKSLFRAAMRGIVPDEILDRRDKVGFATPEIRLSGPADGIPVLHRSESKQALWRRASLVEWSRIFEVGYA